MNIYKELNKIIDYTEKHLEENIDYKKVASIIGINEYTFQKVFLMIADVSFSEYIRNRRLSNAGEDIYLGKEKIIDVAIKYQYNNPTSFSRAFEKFHGIKPSRVKTNPEKLKMYTRLHFDENHEYNKNIDYKIVKMDELTLYGTYIITNNDKIKHDAPLFYKKISEYYGDPTYGLVFYKDKARMYVKSYWVLYDKCIKGMKKQIIPKSKWIVFRINSQNAKDIQNASDTFYKDFLPNSKYSFTTLPEIEYYHDNITDLLIPIED